MGTPEDVIFAVLNSDDIEESDSTGWPLLWGETPNGRTIVVVFEFADQDLIYVVTAYEPQSE